MLRRNEAMQAVNKIYNVHGDVAVTRKTAAKWFVRYCSGNFVVKDKPFWSIT